MTGLTAATGMDAVDASHFRLLMALSSSGAAAAWEWQVRDNRVVGDAGFATLLGISAEDATRGISPVRFFAAIHPADRDRMRLAMAGLLRGAQVLSKQCRIVQSPQRNRWVQVRGWSEAGDDSPVTKLSGVLVDITEQKRLEEQLRIAQTAGGIGTFEHVDGFGTVSVSHQFCTLLGLHPATDLPVRTINAMVHPDDPPLIDVAAKRQLGAVSRVEFRVPGLETDTGSDAGPDAGGERWLTRQGEYVADADGSGLRFSGVVYEITEAKRTEARLRELNETLESRVEERTRERDRIWRVSRHLLGAADLTGRWISVNPAWTTLLGWSAGNIVGRTSDWMRHPDDREASRRELNHLMAGGTTVSFENRLRHQDGGYRWLSWTAVMEDGTFYCVASDITAEKAAAATLAAAEEQLRQSQKMEAVGQLTGGLAHDFNNLLTGISGSLELLQTRMAQGRTADLDRYITAAQSSAKRAAALTHRLLAFSRRQTLEPKPTDLNALIAGIDDLVRRTVGPSIEVEAPPAEGLWATLVDQNQLENALLNLCLNARDAMPDGGRLSIACRNRWLDQQAAAERELPAGQYVCLGVTDTGCGMSPEVASRACDPFFTTKPMGQGTGLGLSMIYGFARQSNGQVHIDSAVGRGTTVSIYLPRHLGQADVARASAELNGSAKAENGETVLVVDDERTVRMLIAEALSDLNYVALEAADGQAALKLLQSDARIDLLITDVGLPGGMNGHQVAEAARALRPDLKVLFVTGYAEAAVLNHGHLAPGMHVLTKPFAMTALANRIRVLTIGG